MQSLYDRLEKRKAAIRSRTVPDGSVGRQPVRDHNRGSPSQASADADAVTETKAVDETGDMGMGANSRPAAADAGGAAASRGFGTAKRNLLTMDDGNNEPQVAAEEEEEEEKEEAHGNNESEAEWRVPTERYRANFETRGLDGPVRLGQPRGGDRTRNFSAESGGGGFGGPRGFAGGPSAAAAALSPVDYEVVPVRESAPEAVQEAPARPTEEEYLASVRQKREAMLALAAEREAAAGAAAAAARFHGHVPPPSPPQPRHLPDQQPPFQQYHEQQQGLRCMFRFASLPLVTWPRHILLPRL